MFTEGGIQAFPDFGTGNLFILTTDWSKVNIAGYCHRYRMGRSNSWGVGEGSATSARRTSKL